MNKIIAIGESIQDGIPTPDEPKEILNKYIDLIDKGYCCDCNELNCIDNFPQAKIAHSIKNLQQENNKLKKEKENLQERIGKAIKYIEKEAILDYESEYCHEMYDEEIFELLEILKGSDE